MLKTEQIRKRSARMERMDAGTRSGEKGHDLF